MDFNNTKPIYLDNASSTKVDDRVLKEMLPFFNEFYGNASSNHEFGKIAKEAIDKSRTQVSKVINCFEDQIIFTSGATESIILALKGDVKANSEKGNHIITIKTEHTAVLATYEYLAPKGIEVTFLEIDENDWKTFIFWEYQLNLNSSAILNKVHFSLKN